MISMRGGMTTPRPSLVAVASRPIQTKAAPEAATVSHAPTLKLRRSRGPILMLATMTVTDPVKTPEPSHNKAAAWSSRSVYARANMTMAPKADASTISRCLVMPRVGPGRACRATRGHAAMHVPRVSRNQPSPDIRASVDPDVPRPQMPVPDTGRTRAALARVKGGRRPSRSDA
jgi:hypothetical protein